MTPLKCAVMWFDVIIKWYVCWDDEWEQLAHLLAIATVDFTSTCVWNWQKLWSQPSWLLETIVECGHRMAVIYRKDANKQQMLFEMYGERKLSFLWCFNGYIFLSFPEQASSCPVKMSVNKLCHWINRERTDALQRRKKMNPSLYVPKEQWFSNVFRHAPPCLMKSLHAPLEAAAQRPYRMSTADGDGGDFC